MFIDDRLENIHKQNEENKNPSTNIMIYNQWFINLFIYNQFIYLICKIRYIGKVYIYTHTHLYIGLAKKFVRFFH